MLSASSLSQVLVLSAPRVGTGAHDEGVCVESACERSGLPQRRTDEWRDG